MWRSEYLFEELEFRGTKRRLKDVQGDKKDEVLPPASYQKRDDEIHNEDGNYIRGTKRRLKDVQGDKKDEVLPPASYQKRDDEIHNEDGNYICYNTNAKILQEDIVEKTYHIFRNAVDTPPDGRRDAIKRLQQHLHVHGYSIMTSKADTRHDVNLDTIKYGPKESQAAIKQKMEHVINTAKTDPLLTIRTPSAMCKEGNLSVKDASSIPGMYIYQNIAYHHIVQHAKMDHALGCDIIKFGPGTGKSAIMVASIFSMVIDELVTKFAPNEKQKLAYVPYVVWEKDLGDTEKEIEKSLKSICTGNYVVPDKKNRIKIEPNTTVLNKENYPELTTFPQMVTFGKDNRSFNNVKKQDYTTSVGDFKQFFDKDKPTNKISVYNIVQNGLVVIDEAQWLFTKEGQLSEEFKKMIKALIKKCKKVRIVLCSATFTDQMTVTLSEFLNTSLAAFQKEQNQEETPPFVFKHTLNDIPVALRPPLTFQHHSIMTMNAEKSFDDLFKESLAHIKNSDYKNKKIVFCMGNSFDFGQRLVTNDVLVLDYEKSGSNNKNGYFSLNAFSPPKGAEYQVVSGEMTLKPRDDLTWHIPFSMTVKGKDYIQYISKQMEEGVTDKPLKLEVRRTNHAYSSLQVFTSSVFKTVCTLTLMKGKEYMSDLFTNKTARVYIPNAKPVRCTPEYIDEYMAQAGFTRDDYKLYTPKDDMSLKEEFDFEGKTKNLAFNILFVDRNSIGIDIYKVTDIYVVGMPENYNEDYKQLLSRGIRNCSSIFSNQGDKYLDINVHTFGLTEKFTTKTATNTVDCLFGMEGALTKTNFKERVDPEPSNVSNILYDFGIPGLNDPTIKTNTTLDSATRFINTSKLGLWQMKKNTTGTEDRVGALSTVFCKDETDLSFGLNHLVLLSQWLVDIIKIGHGIKDVFNTELEKNTILYNAVTPQSFRCFAFQFCVPPAEYITKFFQQLPTNLAYTMHKSQGLGIYHAAFQSDGTDAKRQILNRLYVVLKDINGADIDFFVRFPKLFHENVEFPDDEVFRCIDYEQKKSYSLKTRREDVLTQLAVDSERIPYDGKTDPADMEEIKRGLNVLVFSPSASDQYAQALAACQKQVTAIEQDVRNIAQFTRSESFFDHITLIALVDDQGNSTRATSADIVAFLPDDLRKSLEKITRIASAHGADVVNLLQRTEELQRELQETNAQLQEIQRQLLGDPMDVV